MENLKDRLHKKQANLVVSYEDKEKITVSIFIQDTDLEISVDFHKNQFKFVSPDLLIY
jgi:hypothetical protein